MVQNPHVVFNFVHRSFGHGCWDVNICWDLYAYKSGQWIELQALAVSLIIVNKAGQTHGGSGVVDLQEDGADGDAVQEHVRLVQIVKTASVFWYECLEKVDFRFGHYGNGISIIIDGLGGNSDSSIVDLVKDVGVGCRLNS